MTCTVGNQRGGAQVTVELRTTIALVNRWVHNLCVCIQPKGHPMDIESHRNAKFSAAEAKAQLDRLLVAWWRNTSQSGLAVSEEDIQEVKSAKADLHARVDEMFGQIVEAAVARRAHLQDFSDWKIISVGEDCFSRTVFTRWGIKPSAAFGEKSSPFDLSVHPVSSLIAILKSDFEGYLSSDHLEFSEHYGFCRNTKYRVGFNHEVGVSYSENDFEKLKAAYRPRVERFKAALSAGERTCFVLHIRNPASANWNNVKQLWELLQKRFTGQERLMICISTWNCGEVIEDEYHARIASSDLHLIDVNYPADKYVWHKNAHSPEGHEFEANVIQRCAEILRGGIFGPS